MRKDDDQNRENIDEEQQSKDHQHEITEDQSLKQEEQEDMIQAVGNEENDDVTDTESEENYQKSTSEEEASLDDDPYWKKLKRLKIITLSVIGLIILALSVNIGVHATSTSTFCASCHMMSPQAYTWKASAHNAVECKDCHIAPGFNNMVNAKVDGLWELYYTITDSYTAPIRMPSQIPDESCLKCHNLDTRETTPSGDIIIDHQLHADEEVSCVTCHAGVGHAKISDRRVTYRSDYDRWNFQVAEMFMQDTTYIRPQMDRCMDCHELKRAPLTCETCHESAMYPQSHHEKDFIDHLHGKMAIEDFISCESCHSYLSYNKIDQLKPKTHYMEYLNGDAIERRLTVQAYAKTNTSCVDCHSERPESHELRNYAVSHGEWATGNEESCLTCHNTKNVSGEPVVTEVTCASCHPSGHKQNWQRRHPTRLPENPRYEQSCLTCHVEASCTKCHTAAAQ